MHLYAKHTPYYIYKESILKQKHFKIEEKKWKKQKLK